jgi:hypothetical protein
MATLEQLMDVETETEGVFKTYLATVVPAATFYVSDTNVQNFTPSIRVVSTLIEQGRHQVTVPTGTYSGRPIYDQFRIRTDINLVYDPSFSQAQATLRAKMRVGLSDYNGIKAGFAANNYLALAPDTLRQIDGARVINDAENEETITTTVEGVYFFVPATIAALS